MLSSFRSYRLFFSFLSLLILAPVISAATIYYEPGINPYREQASNDGIESVDPFTGMLKVRHLDLFIPGNGGLDIRVQRTYDSASVYQLGVGKNLLPAMGYGWTFHFGKLTGSYVCNPAANTSAARPVFELPDGTQQKFYAAAIGGHLYISREGWVADCAGADGLRVISPDGLRYEATVAGGGNYQVSRIIDKHGNSLSFSYLISSGEPYVQSITSSDGRSVAFGYISGGATGLRLSSATSNGQQWRYVYGANNTELTDVYRPNGERWSYQYLTIPDYYSPAFVTLRGYLQTVRRPEGGVTAYTYTYVPIGGSVALRITKKSVSNYADWQYRYVFSPGVSTTDVTDPTGYVTTYKHSTPYANSSGEAWRIGLLLEKSSSNYSEQYEWGNQLISYDPYLANTGIAPYVDTSTYRPLLTKKIIRRDGNVHVTQYASHDSYGNPYKIIETGNGDTRTTDLTYYNNPSLWVVGKPAKETIDQTWVTDRTFDSKGNVTSLSKNGYTTHYFGYTTQGDIASVIDANGNPTYFSGHYRGKPATEVQPGGVKITRSINQTGTVGLEVDGEGKRTQYSYDDMNRLTGVFPPIGNSTVISYGVNFKQIDRGNFRELTELDGFGREVSLKKVDKGTSNLVSQAFAYDVFGRKIMETYPADAVSAAVTPTPRIQYTRDALGRITQIVKAGGNTRQIRYLSSNQVQVTDENGHVATYTYRSYGDPDERQLMRVDTPVPATNMAITRNALGQITGMTQAGIQRAMQYDSRAYLVKTYQPEIGWVTYGRDAIGNMISKSVGTAPDVRTINYTYDSRHRLTTIAYQDATTPQVNLSYNLVDDVVMASRGAITRSYGYDANRNLTSESLAVDGHLFNLSYMYDSNDALTQVTYPDTQIVNFYPDAQGRPTAVSPYISGITYHPSGQTISMAYANGVTTTQKLNIQQWPGQMSVVSPSATLINTSYGYDGVGNVISMADSVNTGYNRTLAYDDVDRLVSATGPWGAGSITYDSQGNILSQTYGTAYAKTYTYDTANRLASYTGSTAFTYDAWGNATRSGTALSYHLYDDASNLYCASCDTASPLRFEYDANNYRVKKTRNGIVTYSLYAKDGNLMMEYTPSKGDLKQFAYHNKKQVAMRHVIDPALNIGQVSTASPSRLATIIPRKPVAIDTDPVFTLVPFDSLLSVALLAHAN